MKHKLFKISLLSFCLFLLGFTSDKGFEKEPSSSLLWKIEGPNKGKISYLFGTMHLIQKQYYYFPEALEKVIKKSELIATEIDLDELTDNVAAMKALTLKEGTLFDFFTQEQQDSLYQWAKEKLMMDKIGFRATFSSFKPMVLVQTMTQMQLIGKTESYELRIGELAKKHKLETVGFESLNEQIKIFDDLSKSEQAALVMEGLKNESEMLTSLSSLQAMYQRQEVDSLYWMIKKEGGIMAEKEEQFLNKRNQNWIPQIEKIMSTKACFIAVGAGHLAGDQGLIKLLRLKGYKLTPVKI